METPPDTPTSAAAIALPAPQTPAQDISNIKPAADSTPATATTPEASEGGIDDGSSTDKPDAESVEVTSSVDPLTPTSTVPSEGGKFEDGGEGGGEAAEEEGAITVFHSQTQFNVKHPLAHTWVLWYTQPATGRHGSDWASLLKVIKSFDSVEEFWAIFNNVPPPTHLPQKADYHLFKSGIRPEWEDLANKSGGRFSYTFRDKRNIDALWLDALLYAIGETLEPEGVHEVQGVVVNVRKTFTRISCWTRSTGGAGDEEMRKLMSLGRVFRGVLGLKGAEMLEFAGHVESASSGSARARSSFAV